MTLQQHFRYCSRHTKILINLVSGTATGEQNAIPAINYHIPDQVICLVSLVLPGPAK